MAVTRFKNVKRFFPDSKSWVIYRNLSIPKETIFEPVTQKSVIYCKYKLHISLSREAFSLYEKEITAILTWALDQKIIAEFKVYRVDYVLERERRGGRGIDLRQLESPFVIYLHNDFQIENVKKLMVMLDEIEKLLKDTPLSRKEYADADVAINLTHFLIRQTALQGKEYRAADDAKADLLRAEVLKSEYCAALTAGLVSSYQIAPEASQKKVEAPNLPTPKPFVAEQSKLPVSSRAGVMSSCDVKSDSPRKKAETPSTPIQKPFVALEQAKAPSLTLFAAASKKYNVPEREDAPANKGFWSFLCG